MADLVDPYLSVETGGQTLTTGSPATESSRVTLAVPLPDATTLNLGAAYAGLPAQQGIWGQTTTHIRLRTTGNDADASGVSPIKKASSITLGAAPSASALANGPSGVAVATAGINVWSEGQKNEYILQDVNEEYGARLTRRVAGTRRTTIVGEVTDTYNSNQTVTIDGTYTLKAVSEGGGVYKYSVEATADGEKIERIKDDYELFVGGHLERHIAGDMAEFTTGFTNELFVGGKNGMCVGAFSELTVGLKTEVSLGLTISGELGGTIELCPDKKKFEGSHYEAHINKSVVTAARTTACLAWIASLMVQNEMSSLSNKMAGLKKWASGLSLGNSGANVQSNGVKVIV